MSAPVAPKIPNPAKLPPLQACLAEGPALGKLPAVSALTQVLEAVRAGDTQATEELSALVYNELRRLAAHKMAHEKPGQTLQATALVHEAWLRLAGPARLSGFHNRAHFFGAASEAMRRLLVDRARRRRVLEKGGYRDREELSESNIAGAASNDELLEVNEVLDQLAAEDAAAAALVKLRYFVGMSMPEVAETMGVSLRQAERLWTFARAWLRDALTDK